MNNKIKELVNQADSIEIFPDGLNSGNDFLCDIDPMRVEIFADIIIKECISVVHRRYMGDNNREDKEVLRCVEDLKNHFNLNTTGEV